MTKLKAKSRSAELMHEIKQLGRKLETRNLSYHQGEWIEKKIAKLMRELERVLEIEECDEQH